jgi:hypothetical protein
MANIRKSFNFRNGVQVDDDNFIVNANGLVGIGTSVPTEFLDVHGTAKVTGLVTATNLAITGVSTFYSDVKVGSAITFNPSTGAVRATTFFGSAVGLTDIYAIAVDGWYVNAGNISTTSKVGIVTDFPNYSLQVGQDPLTGNGFSVDAITGNVKTTGIITATKFSGPGDDISNLNASVITSGTLDNARLPQNINVSGVLTAYSFTGFGTNLQGLNATNITNGTLDNSRLPQNISITGIITTSTGVITSLTNTNLNNTGIATLGVANASRLLVSGVTTSIGGFVGNVTGTATTATSISGTPNITVGNITSSNIDNTGIITSSSIISQSSSTGISTVSTRLYAESIGVGTNSPSSDIHIRRSSASILQVTSDTGEAIIAVGRSTTLTGSNGALIFGNTSGIYPYSDSRTLDIVNYDTGSLNYYLHYGSAGVGTGNFNWLYAPNSTNPLMTLSYGGNLGIGITNPTSKLQVSGTVSASSLNVSGDLSAIGAGSSASVRTLYVLNGTSGILDASGNSIIEDNENIYATSGVSTFFDIEVTNNGIFNQRIGIGTTNPLEPLHIGGGSFEGEEDVVVINGDGIGIGTTSIKFGLGISAEGKNAIFGSVGIGITLQTENDLDILEEVIFFVNGPSSFGDNVGIGTSDPTNKLTVVGDSQFYGNLNSSGIGTIEILDVTTGTIDFLSGTNVSYSGIGTIETLDTTTGTIDFLTNTNLNTSGVTTSQNGFTSGIGVTNPVKITVSGSVLTFTVAGVGSTSLILY